MAAALLGELGLEQRRGEWGCVDRRLEAGPQLDDGAEVILMRVRHDDADEILRVRLDEAEVGHDDVDAGIEVPLWKGDAEVDHQPFARLLRSQTVEVAVHPDFAETAERDENEFALAGSVGFTLTSCHYVSLGLPRRQHGNITVREPAPIVRRKVD